MPFAKKYVELNNNLIIEATNNKDEFGKAFYKLINNSCFGHLMMNERKFKTGKFVSTKKNIQKLGVAVSERKLALSNPRCIDWYDLNADSTFVLYNQMKTLTRPIACGVSIFGISKAYMVSMWYKLVDKFGYDNIHLIYTDTDSLVFELKGKTYKEADIFDYIRKDPEFASLFDLRDVPDVHEEAPSYNPYWSLVNKTVMGKFKFEVLGIGEIGACKPKCNSIIVVEVDENGEEHLKNEDDTKR